MSDRVNKVFEHGQFINGPEVTELEEKLAKFVGVKYAIGVGSGTDALYLAVRALGLDGKAVAVPAYTFIASVESIVRAGATPVFCDIDKRTLNIDPVKIPRSVDAIMAVNIFGLPADYELLRTYNVPIIEDAAQSFGAVYRGKRSCSLGDIGCTSFFPSKPLGGCGDGGMIFTNDGGRATYIRSLKEHGRTVDAKYLNIHHGINSRLDSINAAYLLDKFDKFTLHIMGRQYRAAQYSIYYECAQSCFTSDSAWALFPTTSTAGKGRRYYQVPMHMQPVYGPLGYMRGDFPVAEWASNNVTCLEIKV